MHIEEANKKFNNSLLCLFGGALIGVIAFIIIYGVDYLDPTNDSWLINIGSDLSIEYIGWQYYRASSWRFPLALIENAIYPDAFSTMYTDCPPILAVFWKLFSPILPETFQYIGITGILTYALNGALASYLIYEITNNKPCSIIGSTFITLSPIVIARMYAQGPLTYHSIILLAILLFLKGEELNNSKTCVHVMLWSFAMGLGAVTHIYYVPMVFSFVFSFYLIYAIKRKSATFFLYIIVPCIWTIFLMWVFGVLYGAHSYGAVGFGSLNFRLNGFFITGNTSYIQKLLGFHSSFRSDYEAYAYLGAGVFLLATICIVLVLKKSHKNVMERRLDSFLLPCGILTVFAMNPSITFNDIDIVRIPWPQFLVNIFSIFRANGRFIWPVVYAIELWLIVFVINNLKRSAIFVLTLALGIQIFDFCGYYQGKQRYVDYLSEVEPALKDAIWNELADDGYNEIYIFNGSDDKQQIYNTYSIKLLTAISEYAYLNGMVTNDVYCSRKNNERIRKDRELEWNNITRGDADERKIYIFPEYPNELVKFIEIYKADEVYIGLTKGNYE